MQIEMKQKICFPEEIGMILSDLSTGAQDVIIANGSIVVMSSCILQKDRCLDVTHSYILEIQDYPWHSSCQEVVEEEWCKIIYDG